MASVSAVVGVTSTATLLWQTTSGVSPDPVVNYADQIFWAGTPTDPRPIVIENQDATNAVYLGGSGVTALTGTELAAGASLTYNVVGNDSLYAITASATVDVAVDVQRA